MPFNSFILLFDNIDCSTFSVHTYILTLELVSIPTDENMSESQAKDADGRPVLRAAIETNADVLFIGDKDFLESSLKNSLIIILV